MISVMSAMKKLNWRDTCCGHVVELRKCGRIRSSILALSSIGFGLFRI